MSDLSNMFASSLPIEVKRSIPKSLLMLLICAGVAALLIWSLIHDQTHNGWIGGVCAAFFCFGTLVSVYALCDRRPLVLLSHEGVSIRGWNGCPVAWANIERVWKFEQQIPTVYSRVKIDYVCMALEHSKQWRSNQGRIKRKFASYYHALGYGDIYFPVKSMNFEADELVAAIQSHIGGVRLSDPQSLVPE